MNQPANDTGAPQPTGDCPPGECTCEFQSVAYPAIVRCTNPGCQMPVMTLEVLADATHWVRVHHLTGCTTLMVALQSKAEAEARVREQLENGDIKHWSMYFDAQQSLTGSAVYTGPALGPLEYSIAVLPPGDPQGAWVVVLPSTAPEYAERQARELLRTALGTLAATGNA